MPPLQLATTALVASCRPRTHHERAILSPCETVGGKRITGGLLDVTSRKRNQALTKGPGPPRQRNEEAIYDCAELRLGVDR
jgi:hypothetical protein